MPLLQIIGISESAEQPLRQPQSIPKPRLATLLGTFCEIHRREDLEVDKFTFHAADLRTIWEHRIYSRNEP